MTLLKLDRRAIYSNRISKFTECLLLFVRLDRHARPRHERRRAPKVLQAAVELGCKGCGLFPAVRTEIGV